MQNFAREINPVTAVRAISALPDEHCALTLLRYQTGHLDYMTRTTPAAGCSGALATFDRELRIAYERIVGHSVSDEQWAQAAKPTRKGGLGMRSAPAVADAAYYASRAAAWERCEAIWPDFSKLIDDPVREAESRINQRLPEAEQVEPLPIDGAPPPQQAVAMRLAEADVQRLRATAAPLDRARMIAYSAPMAGRWLEATPSKTLDKHMSSSELSITTAVHLGVDVLEGGTSCGFCGAAMDSKGIHPGSCTAGGDTLMRHNEVRNIVFRYCRRACPNMELEKVGILDDPGVLVSLRRPADVLVDDFSVGERSTERMALDIKVINALGPTHFNETLGGALAAAAKYRDYSISHLDTGARCAARGIKYMPLVFTTQGGCEVHAEAVISQIAAAIASAEGCSSAAIKSDMMQMILMINARSVAKAISRRKKRRWMQLVANTGRVSAEIATLQELGEDGD